MQKRSLTEKYLKHLTIENGSFWFFYQELNYEILDDFSSFIMTAHDDGYDKIIRFFPR